MIDFKQLKVWQKAHVLTIDVYRVTNRELRRDRSLAAQTRRAAGSVTANIVEGCGANSQAELGRFLGMSLSSAMELEYHLLLAHDLAYIPTPRYERLRSQVQEVKRMLSGFRRTIRSRKDDGERGIRGRRDDSSDT
jgi:four helix bundle protein